MAHNNLCVEFDRQGRTAEAHAQCTTAVSLSPGFFYPLKTLGLIEEKWAEIDAARRHFRDAHRVTGDFMLELHAATVLPLVYASAADFESRRAQLIHEVDGLSPGLVTDPLRSLVTVPHFYMAFFGQNDAATITKIAELIRATDPVPKAARPASIESLSYVARFVRTSRSSADRAASARVKVGFASRFFREHASGKMIQGIIAGLDPDSFEIHVFNLLDADPGHRSKLDPSGVAGRIAERADYSTNLVKSDGLSKMRATIEERKLDVLVYGEIGMDPVGYLLAFSRLARVQVATHGHASTTGISTIDYFVSYRPFEPPDAQSHYSEQLVTMSDFSPYFKPVVPAAVDASTRISILRDVGLGSVADADGIAPGVILFVCKFMTFSLLEHVRSLSSSAIRSIVVALPQWRIGSLLEPSYVVILRFGFMHSSFSQILDLREALVCNRSSDSV